MIWTSNKPTEPGWYWYRDKVSTWLVRVDDDAGELFSRWVYGMNGDGFRYLSSMNGNWSGPLEPPIDYQAQAVADELPYAN